MGNNLLEALVLICFFIGFVAITWFMLYLVDVILHEIKTSWWRMEPNKRDPFIRRDPRCPVCNGRLKCYIDVLFKVGIYCKKCDHWYTSQELLEARVDKELVI